MPSFFSLKDSIRFYMSADTTETTWWSYPRVFTARRLEAKDVRTPRVYVYLRGGSACTRTDGETVFDVGSLQVRLGFEDDSADRVLAFGTCNVAIPTSSVTVAPRAGDSIWVQLGVDPVNRLTVFRGHVEAVQGSDDGHTYQITAFDEIRRLLDFPYRDASTATDVADGYEYDATETTLYAAVQIQFAELLSAGSVLTHTLTGLEQYPILENGRGTLYEEIAAVLRSAGCRGYLSPTGRLLVTYTDTMPLWAPAMMGDLCMVPLREFAPWTNTNFHLPWNQAKAMWFNRIVATTSLAGGMQYPNQYHVTKPETLHPFEFTEDNVVGVERIEESEVLNEMRARTSPEADTRDFIDMSGMTFEDLETLTFSQLGDASTSVSAGAESVAEYGLRWRTYDLGGLAEINRATNTPTDLGGTGPPAVGYGRYALYRGDWVDAQRRARQFPVERIRITSPGILSVQPFEIVTVRLPAEGVEGFFQIEGRRLEVSSGGFRSVDTLRRMDAPRQLVTLDVREESAGVGDQ